MDERLPEDVLFDFLIANLGGVEDEIRPLIVDHPDAALRWQGAYPPDVVALLAKQYCHLSSRTEPSLSRPAAMVSVVACNEGAMKGIWGGPKEEELEP